MVFASFVTVTGPTPVWNKDNYRSVDIKRGLPRYNTNYTNPQPQNSPPPPKKKKKTKDKEKKRHKLTTQLNKRRQGKLKEISKCLLTRFLYNTCYKHQIKKLDFLPAVPVFIVNRLLTRA